MASNVREGELWAAATALDRLQGPEAQVAHLRFLAECPDPEIADQLGISEKEVARLVDSGLRRMVHTFRAEQAKQKPPKKRGFLSWLTQ